METIEQMGLEKLTIVDLKAIVARAEDLIAEKVEAEKLNLLAEFQEKAASRGIDLSELLMPSLTRKMKRKTVSTQAKYRNPEDHTQTWSGRGKMPVWIREKIEAGANKEDFAIEK